LAYGFGARFVSPTAQDRLGNGKWQVMPFSQNTVRRMLRRNGRSRSIANVTLDSTNVWNGAKSSRARVMVLTLVPVAARWLALASAIAGHCNELIQEL